MLLVSLIPILVLTFGFSNAQQHIVIQNFTTSTGTFSTPHYPANYGANSSYRWYIIENPGLYITLNFQNFAVEGYADTPCKYDWVIVVEGEDNVNTMKDCTVPPTVSKYSGLYCNYHTPPATLQFSSNIVAVQFCSDVVIEDKGFNITFETSRMPPVTTVAPPPTTPTTPPQTPCGASITVDQDTTQNIVSPNFPPGPYPPNANCTWIVTSNAPTLKITSTFFEVEGYSNNCYYDRLTITGPNKGTMVYCMTRGPNLEFHDTPPYTVTIGFVSDDIIQYPGFELVLAGFSGQPVDSHCNSSNTLYSTTDSYTFYSPGWPYDYDNNVFCYYNIINAMGDHNHSIQLQFVSFNTEASVDRLTVASSNNVTRQFDGYIPPNTVSIFPATQLTAVFKTDDNIVDKGFQIVATLVPNPFSCQPQEFRCRTVDQCIPVDKLCDHVSDCLDASDEIAAVCQLKVDCGISTVKPNINIHGTSFIVNGTQAKPYSWPWVVGIYRYTPDYLTCGGTLIMPRWVLTSARCVYSDNGDPSIFIVKAGSYEIRASYAHEQIVNVTSIITHPKFNPVTFENDIALILLAEDITFDDYVNAACLPHNTTLQSNEYCVMTGWGSTVGTGNDTVLRQMLAVTIPTETCNSTDYYNGKIDDTQVCAGDPLGNAGICARDFGGPLACPNAEGRYFVQGVASQNNGRANCVSANKPGIFTRTSEFMQFISETMEEYNKQ